MKKKKSTIAMIFAIIVFAISSTAFAFQNEPNGFRDFKFGMTLEQVRKIAGKDSLIPIPHDGPVIVPMDREQNAYYMKLTPPMISNVKTDEMATIAFFKNQLMSIEITIHGDKDRYSPKEILKKFDDLNSSMQLLYGTPEIDGFARTWYGSDVKIELACLCNNENMNIVDKDVFDKLNERNKEGFRNHVSIHMESPRLRSLFWQCFKEQYEKKRLERASQGW